MAKGKEAKKEIIITGFGGQGIVLAGHILGQAVALVDHRQSTLVQSYGPEARGGATMASVIISEEPIRYPKVVHPHILVCLTQEAYNKFSGIIWPGGLLLTDSHYIKQEPKVDARQVELEMYRTVMDKIGKPIVFNICMLGAVMAMVDLISPEAIMKVLENRIPADFLDLNRQALELGLRLGGEYKF